jgi:hypothetical protein
MSRMHCIHISFSINCTELYLDVHRMPSLADPDDFCPDPGPDLTFQIGFTFKPYTVFMK